MNIQLHLSPKIVRRGEGECLELPRETRHQLLDGRDTRGALALARSQFQPGARTPLHLHTREDEWFFVLRGEFCFQFAEDTRTLQEGDFVFGPRGVPHSYTCQSEDGGELLIGVLDAGFEEFFRELAKEHENGAFPGPGAMRDKAHRYGVRFDEFESPKPLALSPKITGAKEGECLEAFGDRVRVLLSSSSSGGRFCLVEGETPSFAGPPMHVHEREDEVFFIRAGRFEFVIGDARVQASPGDVVFAPRGISHSFRVVSGEPGRALVLCAPGGFDLFFGNCAHFFERGEATPQRIEAIAAPHGIRFLPCG